MSRLSAFFTGIGFRTNRPTFEPGEEVVAFVTGVEDGRAVVRVGDTKLYLEDPPENPVDLQVRLRIDEFDGNDHDGTATYLETVGQSSY
ncbi:DUF7513 family protein [Halobacterium zhouii]|uniref:DUF7513 family protein n=1 Tax=Halobacterium zhouii TaxID=2902624 RepID=UPI001E2ACB2B|nr:hypothetical protein [Halobacterium zhouii]